MRHNFLFKYDDPEIAKWFNNQPQGTKAKALEQALNIIIANYGTGNLQKAIAKKAVLYSGPRKTNADIIDVKRTSKINKSASSTTKSIDQTQDAANQQLSSKLDNSVDDPAKGTNNVEGNDDRNKRNSRLDMLSDL